MENLFRQLRDVCLPHSRRRHRSSSSSASSSGIFSSERKTSASAVLTPRRLASRPRAKLYDESTRGEIWKSLTASRKHSSSFIASPACREKLRNNISPFGCLFVYVSGSFHPPFSVRKVRAGMKLRKINTRKRQKCAHPRDKIAPLRLPFSIPFTFLSLGESTLRAEHVLLKVSNEYVE